MRDLLIPFFAREIRSEIASRPDGRAAASRRSASALRKPAAMPDKLSTNHVQYLIMLAVFLDYTGVALVLPNMLFRWCVVASSPNGSDDASAMTACVRSSRARRKEVGISPSKLAFVSSIYSGSQLVGGLIIGRLGDRGLGRKRTLLLSFAGAGVSYALVGLATSIEMLVLSRVLVGLVKQTMTCSTALITQSSSEATRSAALGRLSSATTLAFLFGQAAGGALSSRFGRRVPCFVASALFALNFALVLLLLPNDAPPSQQLASDEKPPAAATARVTRSSAAAAAAAGSSVDNEGDKPSSPLGRVRAGLVGFVSNFAAAFRSRLAREALLFRLSYAFLMRATYTLHQLYEQQRWNLSPETTGYLSTYRTALSIGVDSVLVGLLSRRLSETDQLLIALTLSAGNAALEGSHSTMAIYACVNMPISSMTGCVTRAIELGTLA